MSEKKPPLIFFPESAPQERLDHFLVKRFSFLSRNQIQKAIAAEKVWIDGKPTKASHILCQPTKIELKWPLESQEAPLSLQPSDIPLDIVYEDQHLVVVNKSAEMVVHPGCGHREHTLVNALLHHFGALPNMPGNVGRPGLVHRLDKGTSGLLLVGKTPEAVCELQRQFMERSIKRRYTALVWGQLKKNSGCIDRPLAREKKDRRRMTTHLDGRAGKHAITHYQVVESLGWVSLLHCHLETGRTHQIRAHLSSIGHPLFGDARYGGDALVVGAPSRKFKAFVCNNLALFPHQALHAAFIGCMHPKTKQPMAWEAPLPPNFHCLLDRFRRYYRSSFLP